MRSTAVPCRMLPAYPRAGIAEECADVGCGHEADLRETIGHQRGTHRDVGRIRTLGQEAGRSSMKRRLVLAAGMSMLLIATLMPGATAARTSERFGRVHIGGRHVTLDQLPSQKGKNRIVDVAVQLSGRPVTAYQGDALESGSRLSESRKADVRRLLAVRQSSTRARLVALGAKVQYTYTDVFNGFRIRVRAKQLPAIAKLPGVTGLFTVSKFYRANTNTVDYLGADKTWGQTGFTGKGVSIAIIDSGINYYHVDFGGAGFKAWKKDDPTKREPGTFPTAKVIAGHDLAGDDYNADSNPNPSPDRDPLDCKAKDAGTVQHGTHVAGTAAGIGVTSNGKTYAGSYNAGTLNNVDFRIAPGVAPQAKLMAFRVFGCDGSTSLVVDAIEMAVRAGADIINMSLGSPLGNPLSLDAVATNNASLAGTTVVASVGNDGPSAYAAGSPGVATYAIAVGAMDAQKGFPGATVQMATGPDIDAQNSNGGPLPASGTVNYFQDDPSTPTDPNTGEGGEDLGCFPADYAYNGFSAGQIAVVTRGICARVDRATAGQDAGAAAVIMINNSTSLPPFENSIAGVTIPFIGVASDADAAFQTDDGNSISIVSAGQISNPTFKHTADFTSAEPRRGDSGIKPDVTAPGVSVFSADGGTVAQGKSLSGTSMASPAVAGVAALVKQAHPSWLPRTIKAAIVGTAAPGRLQPYDLRLAGSGLAQPRRAVDTVAYVYTDPGSSSLAFGYQAGNNLGGSAAFSESKTFTIRNSSSHSITYSLSNKLNGPSLGLHTTISPSSVTVPAGAGRTVRVTISLSRSSAAALPDAAPGHGPVVGFDVFGQLHTPITTIAGAIIAKPSSSGAGVYSLRVPWQVVPHGDSNITELPSSRTAYTVSGGVASSSVKFKNTGLHKGIADVYAWGLQDANDGLDGIDLRAAGVQSIDPAVCDSSADASDRCLVFAVNTWTPWNNAAENEIDVLIDVDHDGVVDFLVAAVDLSLVLGIDTGVTAAAIVDAHAGSLVNLYLASAATNSSTVLLPVLASDLGLEPSGDHQFDYQAASFEVYDNDGTLTQFDTMTTGLIDAGASPWARFDVFSPSINNGQFKTIGKGVTKSIPLTVKKSSYQPKRGQQGWMVVTLEDASGASQADFLPVGALP